MDENLRKDVYPNNATFSHVIRGTTFPSAHFPTSHRSRDFASWRSRRRGRARGCKSGVAAAPPSAPKRGAVVSSVDSEACRLSLGADLRGRGVTEEQGGLGGCNCLYRASTERNSAPPVSCSWPFQKIPCTSSTGSSVLRQRPLSRCLLWETQWLVSGI